MQGKSKIKNEMRILKETCFFLEKQQQWAASSNRTGQKIQKIGKKI